MLTACTHGKSKWFTRSHRLFADLLELVHYALVNVLVALCIGVKRLSHCHQSIHYFTRTVLSLHCICQFIHSCTFFHSFTLPFIPTILTTHLSIHPQSPESPEIHPQFCAHPSIHLSHSFSQSWLFIYQSIHNHPSIHPSIHFHNLDYSSINSSTVMCSSFYSSFHSSHNLDY